jgi:hypothetical protein
MNALLIDQLTRRSALEHAADQARLAPSVHNTQPWRFHIDGHGLEVVADRSRQLSVLDPTGRQLLVSCGCAVLNARVGLAARGFGCTVAAFADPFRPDLVARLELDHGSPDPTLAALDHVVAQRQTNRRTFGDGALDEGLVGMLRDAARAEGAKLRPIATVERTTLARLCREADREQNADPAYRAELRRWTSGDPGRLDGVRALTIPRVEGEVVDEMPLRDFDTQGQGWLPATHCGSTEQLFVLSGGQEDPAGWLQVGQALERVLLEVARHGYVANPMTQVIEVDWARAALRSTLALQEFPDVLLRVGWAPTTPGSLRRNPDDLITESGT